MSEPAEQGAAAKQDPPPAPENPPAPKPAPEPPPKAEPPAAATKTETRPSSTEVKLTSAQLKERLTEASSAREKALLKELGFEKPEDLKGALAKLKELETANLSAEERTQKELEELRAIANQHSQTKAEFERTQQLYQSMVEEQFKGLPENVQQAIDEEAKGDANERLRMMRVLKLGGLINAPIPPAPPAPPPKPAPASNNPSPAPASGGTPTKYEEWEQMKGRSPLLGDLFYQQNQREIERSRPA